ncbi:MAG: terpene cyclase/mutase family protein [Kiritimatiellae bacterium]|nr:terpene cyclase/mutase family protein [Kiritimatiellia bacterium]
MAENEEILEEVAEVAYEDQPEHNLLDLFENLTLKEKMSKLVYGLSQSKDSGAYKWSKLQLVRMSAPVSAVIMPIIFFMLLMVFASMEKKTTKEVKVKIKEEQVVEKLDEPLEFEQEPIEPPEPVEIDFVTEAQLSVDVQTPIQSADVSPMPAKMDTVASIKSPVKMRGIFGGRTGGARGAALKAYGGNGITEGAVMRALRWLKKNQRENGTWGGNKESMTALGLLTFLAHGETPASEEFGPTVEKAIKYLVDARDSAGGWPRRYQHAICTYAMCEAYALTKVPMLKEVCETGIDIIIKGQNPTGGWCYAFKPPEADDTSVMGWCAQALKAAKMAGIHNSDMDNSIKLSIMGFQKNASPSGGFGYRGPGATGLSGVGVLCMQLLGAANKAECKNGLAYLDAWTFDWDDLGKGAGSPIYYWYYITQAKFHEGGARWDSWNAVFWKELVKHQEIEKDAIADVNGKMQDIGHWVSPGKNEHNGGGANVPVMDTCLSALQLQVYYRYLPTFKKDATVAEEDVDFAQEEGDLDIEIEI